MVAPDDPWHGCTAREAFVERTMRVELVLTGPEREHMTEEGSVVRIDNKWWIVVP